MVHKSKLFGIFAKAKRISEQEGPQASKKFKSEVQLQSEITSQLSKSGCTPDSNSYRQIKLQTYNWTLKTARTEARLTNFE